MTNSICVVIQPELRELCASGYAAKNALRAVFGARRVVGRGGLVVYLTYAPVHMSGARHSVRVI